jgi:hypothetical protein
VGEGVGDIRRAVYILGARRNALDAALTSRQTFMVKAGPAVPGGVGESFQWLTRQTLMRKYMYIVTCKR